LQKTTFHLRFGTFYFSDVFQIVAVGSDDLYHSLRLFFLYSNFRKVFKKRSKCYGMRFVEAAGSCPASNYNKFWCDNSKMRTWQVAIRTLKTKTVTLFKLCFPFPIMSGQLLLPAYCFLSTITFPSNVLFLTPAPLFFTLLVYYKDPHEEY
jgi:hypothetical protein